MALSSYTDLFNEVDDQDFVKQVTFALYVSAVNLVNSGPKVVPTKTANWAVSILQDKSRLDKRLLRLRILAHFVSIPLADATIQKYIDDNVPQLVLEELGA